MKSLNPLLLAGFISASAISPALTAAVVSTAEKL